MTVTNMPTGAVLSRSNTTAVAAAATTFSTPALLPHNVFDTIEVCSPDITVDLTNNMLTVGTPGWYDLVVNLLSSSFIEGNNSSLALVLYKNGLLHRGGQALTCPAGPNGPNTAAAHFVLPLSPGDNVQIGNDVCYANLTRGLNIVGPASSTYLTMVLL